MSMRMTSKQRAFIFEYLKDFNATRAAKNAGYSERTAYSIGWELLKKPEIQEEIERQIELRAMSADEVLVRLTDIARGDIKDLADKTARKFALNLKTYDENGNEIFNPHTKLIKRIKQKVTVYTSGNEDGGDREVSDTEIELYSAHEALRDLAKYHNLFTDKDPINIELKPQVTIYVPHNGRDRTN